MGNDVYTDLEQKFFWDDKPLKRANKEDMLIRELEMKYLSRTITFKEAIDKYKEFLINQINKKNHY